MRHHLSIGLLTTTALCAPVISLAQTVPAPANDAEYQANWGLGMIDALSANQQGFTGEGVTVAIVDDGLDVEHPEFTGRISDKRLTYAAGTESRDVSHVADNEGNIAEAHGTHVAGIVAAARDGVTEYPANMQGVAYGATILPIQAIGITTSLPAGKDASNEAIRYAADNGAGVLNGSFGPNTLPKMVIQEDGTAIPNANYVELRYQPLFQTAEGLRDTHDALAYAAKKDVVLVFAAGNEFTDQPVASAIPDGNGALPLLTPKGIRDGLFRLVSNADAEGFDLNDEGTWQFVDPFDPVVDTLDFSDLNGALITVVAVAKNGDIADYSNRCGAAAEWCIAAPGGEGTSNEAQILSTWQVNANSGGTRLYKYDDGTSMAAPHVSGAAAVVRSAFPYLNARQTIETILTTATDIGDEATFGQGLLNVGAAVNGPMALRYDGVFDVDTGGAVSVWSNPISGPGDLTKRGAGALILTGTGTYTGPTTVLGGTLAVDGSIISATTASGGGRLAGTGTVGAVTLGDGGVVAPGSTTEPAKAIETLSVDGDFVQGAGSVYEADVADDGASDRLAVSGTARIEDGATLSLTSAETEDPALGTTYTLLTAADGVSGTYAAVAGLSSDLPLVDYALDYGATDVNLAFERSDVAFASLAATFSQRSVATAIESQGTGNTLFDSIVFLGADDAGDAFQSLSGEFYASARSVLTDDAAFVRGAVTDRLRAAFGGVAASSAPVMSFVPTGTAIAAPEAAGAVAWARAFGAWGRLDGGDAADVDTSSGGLFAGADMPVGDAWRVGAVLGYNRVTFDADAVASSGASDNTQFGVYAGGQWGQLGFRSGATFAWNSVDADRAVAYDSFENSLSSDFDARTAQAFGEFGYRVDTAGAAYEPYVNLAYVHLETDGFEESGGAAALSADDSSSGTAFSTLGIRLAKAVNLGGAEGVARADLGWRYAFGDVMPEMALALADGTAFDIHGTPVARNAALIGAGLDLTVSESATLAFTYQGQFASEAQQNAVTGTLTIRF